MSLYQGLGVYIVLVLLLTSTWLFLDTAGPWVWGSLLLFLTFLTVYGSDREVRIKLTWENLRRAFNTLGGDGVAAGLCASLIVFLPVSVLLILTWGQEFPYVGDQHFHMELDRYTYFFVRDHFNEILLILGTLVFCGLVGWIRYWVLLVMAFFILSAYGDDTPAFVVRYPGTGRFVTTPWFHFAETFHWDSLLNAARLANAAGIVIWLWLLRPIIVKRWPDLSILPVAAAFFFQVDVVYYFTSSYLEPWSLIFILLALEYQIVNNQKSDCYTVPLLLLGLAATTKEHAAVMLPVVWLAARPWRFGVQNFVRSIIVGVAAGTPFLVYYLLRVHYGERAFVLLEPEAIMNLDKAIEITNRFDFHFGTGGELLLVLLVTGLIASIPYLRDKKATAWLLIGVLVTQFWFFNVEEASRTFTGYPRFYLHMFLFLCCLFLVLYQAWPRLSKNKVFIASATLLAILLNSETLLPYMGKTFESDSTRNFTEQYSAPVFLPIKTLVEEADNAGKLERHQNIRINNPLGWDMPSIGIDYPQLAARFSLHVEKKLSCVCENAKEAILQPFVYFDGLNAHMRDPSLKRPHQRTPQKKLMSDWEQASSDPLECLTELNMTCSFVGEHRVNGDLVGIIGIY